jgi:hypothetical protein
MSTKEETQATINMLLTVCGTIIVVFVLGCITYGCTQPKQLDPSVAQERIIENNKMVSCVRAGGSWIPVSRPGYAPQMSCVTDKTLPLAEKMNTEKL